MTPNLPHASETLLALSLNYVLRLAFFLAFLGRWLYNEIQLCLHSQEQYAMTAMALNNICCVYLALSASGFSLVRQSHHWIADAPWKAAGIAEICATAVWHQHQL